MAGWRDILQLFRIHTACLSMAAVALGAILGGVRDIWVLVLLCIWGLLFHASGFLQNNIYDYRYDIRDDSKRHFPLVSGRVKYSDAVFIFKVLIVSGFALGLALSQLLGGGILGISCLLGAGVAGTGYNVMSKRWRGSSVLISFAFGFLPLFGYFSVRNDASFEIFLLWLFAFTLMLFEIGYLGYLKDIRSDPVNILRDLGGRVSSSGYFVPNRAVKAYAWLLKVPNFASGILVWYYISPELLVLVFIIVLYTVISWVVYKLTSDKLYFRDRKSVVFLCSVVEILSYWALVIALWSVLGAVGCVIFLFAPFVWFVVMNRLTWGAGWASAPRV